MPCHSIRQVPVAESVVRMRFGVNSCVCLTCMIYLSATLPCCNWPVLCCTCVCGQVPASIPQNGHGD